MAVKRRFDSTAEEINLIPVMNLVSILIPFLLMAAQFVNLAVIDSTLPAIGPPQPMEETDKPPLMLSIMITDKGLTIAGADAVLKPGQEPAAPPAEGVEEEPTVPCPQNRCTGVDDYNFTELTRLLGLVKDEYPNDQNVILVPESRIPYEVIVRVMDASREDATKKDDDGKNRELFPFVVIAGGAE